MKRKHIILALASVAVFSSCKKLIEVPETDLLAGDLALSQITFAEQATLGGYAGVNPDMGILLNATFSDEVVKAEFYNAVSTHEWQYGPADVGLRDNFTAFNNYWVIDRVNRVLAALPTSDSTKVGDETKRIRLKGECLFLRAYAHFELFRYYCQNYNPTGLGMPYMETSSIAPTPRIDMGAYFNKINADLIAAKPLVAPNLSDINRANIVSVAGLQARVALYMRDWANAETFATEYINALPLADIATFPGIWTDANQAEQAYRIIRTPTSGGKLGSLFRGTSAAATNPGTISWKPSQKLWTAYGAGDVRFTSYLKSDPILTALSRDPQVIFKYAGGAYATSSENVANVKVMRTAEMVLIRAEARAELNRFTGANSAETDLNLLRSNRITGYVNVTLTSKQEAIDEIIQERFKELAYEGHRFWDLKRKSLPVSRLLIDAPSAAGQTLAADNFRFTLPIPLPEITANPIMRQNQGYQ